jgi:hypothetical protein
VVPLGRNSQLATGRSTTAFYAGHPGYAARAQVDSGLGAAAIIGRFERGHSGFAYRAVAGSQMSFFTVSWMEMMIL